MSHPLLWLPWTPQGTCWRHQEESLGLSVEDATVVAPGLTWLDLPREGVDIGISSAIVGRWSMMILAYIGLYYIGYYDWLNMNIYIYILYIYIRVCAIISTRIYDGIFRVVVVWRSVYQTGNVQGSSPAACSAGEVVTRSWSPWQKWSVLVSFGWSQNWLKWQIWNPGNPCIICIFWCTMVVSC